MPRARRLFRFPPRPRTSAQILFAVITALAGLPAQSEAQLPHHIPDLCASPTVASVRNGSWSDPGTWSIGQVPSVNDRVVISGGTTVTYDRQSDADIQCVKVSGQLTFRTDTSTRLTVGTLMVMPGAGLQIGTSGSPVAAGVTAEIVISDRPIDPGIDPEQFGTGVLGFGRVTMHGAVKSPTFVRLAAEANAGQASLSLSAGVSGWNGGDRVIVPGTNQASNAEPFAESYQGQWETPTLASASGSSLALTSGLAFPHRGGRNAAGGLIFLPHVGNISRNIIIRSQNPNGTRGHVLMTDRAEVDIRYVAFRDLGRTTISPLDSATLDSSGHATHIGSNQIGRYSLHMHHLFGPASPPPGSYQYVLMGNAIDGGTKWGITIHNTHYGLVQDNVVYNAPGAGIMTEDGSETGNVIQNNFIVRSWGSGGERHDGRAGSNDWGWEGTGIWLRGPDNVIRNNVVANSPAYGAAFYINGNVMVPNAPGDDPHVSGHTVNMMHVPLREFSGNEFYATHHGIEVWHLNAQCCMEVYDAPWSTILNTKLWHVGVMGFYGYGLNRLVFDGWVHYNDPAPLSSPHENAQSIHFGDYLARNVVVRNSDIQGLRIGVWAPIKAGDTGDIYGSATGTLTVENSVLKNFWNIYVTTPYGVTGGGVNIPPRLTLVRNVQFSNVAGVSDAGGQAHVFRRFADSFDNIQNILVSDRVVVESFNGSGTDTFEVYGTSQAPTFVIPTNSVAPQVVGMTNAQAWSSNGVAISGAVAPCSTTRTGIEGFVCAVRPLPFVEAAPGSTSPTPTPAPPPSSSAPAPTSPTPTPTTGCTTPDPFVSLGGGTCVNGVWVAPSTSTPTPTPTTGCTTPDPFASLGGGTCVNGVWVAPTTSTTTGCTTVDPFLSLGGGTCVNGGWLPPDGSKKGNGNGGNGGNGGNAGNGGSGGSGGNGSGGNGSSKCKGPDPFASVGGSTCVNGVYVWVPPTTSTTTPTTGCTTPDPFVSLGGGTCVNGGWLPPSLAPVPTPAPAPGTPTTSTITVISGPTTIQNGQILWKFQSVESPNWQTALWGTDTHRFNVTIIPGSGPLPVILFLHGSGGGSGGPMEFVDSWLSSAPGIYVSPVDIGYINGAVDPITGQGRWESWWMGYKDAAGVFQPITADRVTRYVQWVLTQTSKWNPDPNRVYVQGGAMGGGGAQKIALLNPTIYAAGVSSSTGWIDLNAWVSGTDCVPGMRWRTATGPLCTDMHDTVYLVTHQLERKVPLFLTWDSDDYLTSAARYPALLAALEAQQHGYMAEWHTIDGYFTIAGDPHLQYRLNVVPTIVAPTGSSPTNPAGARTNLLVTLTSRQPF